MPTKPPPPKKPPPPREEEEASGLLGGVVPAVLLFVALAGVLSCVMLAWFAYVRPPRSFFALECESRAGIVLVDDNGIEVCFDRCEGRGP